MIVTMCAMHMLVRNFIRCSGAHISDGAGKIQFHTGERVIAVDSHGILSYVGHFVDNEIVRVFRAAFEVHTDDHVIGNELRGSTRINSASYSPKVSSGSIATEQECPTSISCNASSTNGKMPP